MSIVLSTPGNFPTYRFYITEGIGSTSYEVFPLNFLASSLVDSLEKDQIFYRRKFTGTLTFGTNSLVIDDSGVTQNRRDDWQFFWDQENHDPCAKLYFTITKTVSGFPVTYWEGHFSTTDGNFDIDNCTFEVTPLAEDDYTDALTEADTQYNILGTSPVVTTSGYTRNRWLIDVIEYIAQFVFNGAVTVSSDFFTVTPNYVTLTTNHLTLLTIAQKSDIKRPFSANPATSAMLSWNELMNILWVMFQVKWDYDGVANNINIEHISWWTKAAGIDLRTQLACVATNKYSYTKEQMPKYEKYTFMESDNANFVGYPIWYESQCVNQDPDSNSVEFNIPVTTDLNYIAANSSPDTGAISDEGFVILCNYLSGGLYYIHEEVGIISPVVRANMHLSMGNLMHRYFRHNRVLIEGYLNAFLTTFWTALKTKKQDCSIILCSDLDPTEEITTELGEVYFAGAKATIQQAEIHPDDSIKLSLLYGPADNAQTPITDNKWIQITEGACGVFHAVLSEATAVDLHIDIDYVIFENDHFTTHCSVLGEIWTIPAGAGLTADKTIAFCGGGIPVGGCVYYAHISYDFTDYAVDWVLNETCRC